MDGRWTIAQQSDCGRPAVEVPVVPCDDAAVERAAVALCQMFRWTDKYAQSVARDVLRAAGDAS